MTTRYVVSGCCAAPIGPLRADVWAEVLLVGCVACRTVYGAPGPEEGPEVAEAIAELDRRELAWAMVKAARAFGRAIYT